MGVFNGSDKDRVILKNYDRTGSGKLNLIFFLIAIFLLQPPAAQSAEKVQVAVLPFRIHALKPLDHLIMGLQEMITARIAGKGLPVVNPSIVNRHPKVFMPFLQASKGSASGLPGSALF